MTYRDFVREFRADMERIDKFKREGDGWSDAPMQRDFLFLRECFSEAIDAAHRAGHITDRQVQNWVAPSWCNPPKERKT